MTVTFYFHLECHQISHVVTTRRLLREWTAGSVEWLRMFMHLQLTQWMMRTLNGTTHYMMAALQDMHVTPGFTPTGCHHTSAVSCQEAKSSYFKTFQPVPFVRLSLITFFKLWLHIHWLTIWDLGPVFQQQINLPLI